MIRGEEAREARDKFFAASERDRLIQIQAALIDGEIEHARWLIEQGIARIYAHGELVRDSIADDSPCIHHYVMISGGMRCHKCGNTFGVGQQ